jgi:hypothetical protein
MPFVSIEPTGQGQKHLDETEDHKTEIRTKKITERSKESKQLMRSQS